MPQLIEILRKCSKTNRIEQAQHLLLCMQKRFTSLRFVPGCNVEKAGDVFESTGGMLSPWRTSAKCVLQKLTEWFSLREDDVKETLEAMGALARHCINLYTHSVQLKMKKTEVYDTIRKLVKPIIWPCSGTCCAVCESLDALSRTPSSGSASSVMGPAASATSPAEPATGLPAAQATGPAAAPTALSAPPVTDHAPPQQPMNLYDWKAWWYYLQCWTNYQHCSKEDVRGPLDLVNDNPRKIIS